jgi:adenosylcobinamide kinase/adenosylcobinamide-phosphate guanylyltransferase
VIVSGDLFSDGRRYGAETEDYLKRLAGINRQLAQSADLVLEAVCSVPVLWKGEWPCTT